jgi:hypothetical protein
VVKVHPSSQPPKDPPPGLLVALIMIIGAVIILAVIDPGALGYLTGAITALAALVAAWRH